MPPDAPSHADSRTEELAPPDFSPRVLFAVAPIATFWVMRQLVGTQPAIGASLGVAVFVFIFKRHTGAIGLLAVLGLVIVAGGALAGIVLNSDTAYLANDVVGDFVTASIAAGSLLYRRPLFGLLVRELSPRIAPVMPERHAVFVLLTLALMATQLTTGSVRVVMLQEFSTGEYLLWSRVLSWSLSGVLIVMAFGLIGRTMARAARVVEAAEAG